jgi:outer membrane receptor protein involved in Fe transport
LVLAAACALPSGLLINTKAWSQAVDEITVSARRREESLQDVPISVSAFTAQQLRDRNIDNAYNVAEYTPNFTMARNLGRRLDRPIIRGQFQPGRGEPNASFFVDGVFVSGNIVQSSLDNVERVEVLRGPQAALFGRATFAGAINYITADLSDTWTGEVNARAGSDQDYKLSAWTSGPLIEDKLKVYVGAGWQSFGGEWRNDLREGQVDASNNIATSQDPFNGPFRWALNVPDVANGAVPCPAGYIPYTDSASGITAQDVGCPPQRGDNTKLGEEETRSATLKFEFTPTDALQLNFKAEYADSKDGHFTGLYFDRSFGPVDGVQLAPGLNCNPPVYDEAAQIYIPSPGWYCGELDIDGLRHQFNLPQFDGVASAPPGFSLGLVARDENDNPILDANGNFVPLAVSPPPPFIGADTDTQRFLLEGIYDWNEWQFIARATAGSYDEDFVRDLDRTPALGPTTVGLFEGYTQSDAEDMSFEFKVKSPESARLRGFAGLYYFDYEQDIIGRRFNGFADQVLGEFSSARATENFAVFGSVEYDLNEQWTIAIDARYAEDTITRFWSPALDADCRSRVASGDLPAGTVCGKAEETFDSITPRFILRYQPNDDLNFYAHDNVDPNLPFYALGDDCSDPDGIFAAVNLECGGGIVKEEKTWTYELGAKMSLFDSRLVANIALFYIDWTDQAIDQSYCAPQNPELGVSCESFLGVKNAGESSVTGTEVEINWAATDDLLLGLTYGLAKTEIKDNFFSDQFASFTCNWWEWSEERIPENIPDCAAQGAGDASGQEGPLVPKHNATLSADYTRPFINNSELIVRNFLIYNSKQYLDVSNQTWIGDSLVWNASVGVRTERWLVTAYFDNITDEDTPTIAFDFPLFDASQVSSVPDAPFFGGKVTNAAGFVYPAAFILTPRRGSNFGVTLQYRFGG